MIIILYLKIFLVIRSRASSSIGGGGGGRVQKNKIILNLKRLNSVTNKTKKNDQIKEQTKKLPVVLETNLDYNKNEEIKVSTSVTFNEKKKDSEETFAFLPNNIEISNYSNNNNNKHNQNNAINKRESTVSVDVRQLVIKPKKSVASIASKKEKKVTKTLAIVLIVYLVCWLVLKCLKIIIIIIY